MDSEDVDGDAGDFRFAGAIGLPVEALAALAMFGADLFGCAHRRLPGHVDRCGLALFGVERGGPSRPTGGPLPCSLCARAGGSLTVSLCVPAELAEPSESVLGVLPGAGVTFGYMNLCVISSFRERDHVCPRIRQLCLKFDTA
jgi:hypothetical protein